LVFFNNGDGRNATIAGMPAVGSAGTYPLRITSIDSKGGRKVQTLNIIVAPIASDIPIVTNVNPDSSSGGEVTIAGRNLSEVTAVLFGEHPAPSFTKVGPGMLIIPEPPPGVNGTVDVTVSSPAGTSPVSVDDRFTYNVAPQVPVIVSVRPEGLGILATWASNATSDEVATYTVTATIDPEFESATKTDCPSPLPTTVPGTATAALLPGLCAGVPYTLALTATNAWGTGPPSAPSDTAVPFDVQPPTAPLIRSVLSRPQSLIVDWSPPAMDGGSGITQYTLTAAQGGMTVSTSTPAAAATEATISGLTDGEQYTVSLVAESAAGPSPAATASGTPSSTQPPTAPSGLQVVPDGHGHVMVTWSPPADGGSRGLTGYLLTYWTALPGPVCATRAKSSLPNDWTPPRSLLIEDTPRCARGFTDVTINGQRMSAGLKGDRLKLTSGGGHAIAAGTTVVFNHPVVIDLPASASSRRLVGLSGMNYYAVSVRAKSSAGTGPPIEATQSVTPTVHRARNTEILPSATMSALRSRTVDGSGLGHVLIWPSSTTFQPPLVPGLVLIGSPAPAAPEGFLAQVQTVTTTTSGDIEVDTTPANASQAFTTMSFSYSGRPPIAPGDAGHAVTPGVRAAPASVDPQSFSFSWSNGTATIGFNIWSNDTSPYSIDGQVALTPSVSFSASLYCRHHNYFGCYSWGASAATSASLGATASVIASLNGELDPIDLFNYNFVPITFAVGPIVVWFIPQIHIDLVLSGNISLTGTASVSVAGGASWDSVSGFGSNHSASSTVFGSPTLALSLQGTISLRVRFALCMYGFMCGYIRPAFNLDVNVYFSGPPFFELCPSVPIDVGLMINFWGLWSSNTDATLATISLGCYTTSTAPVSLSISPSSATVPIGANVKTFTATRSDGGTPSNNWALQNPVSGDTISPSGMLSTCCVGGNRALIVVDTDTSSPAPIGPAGATVTVGSTIAYDPPTHLGVAPIGGVIVFLGQTLHVTATAISWTAPVNTGGAPITSYLVKVNGVTYSTNGPTTHLNLPASILLTWVTVQVRAVNANGVASPTATRQHWLAVGLIGPIS
jgi:hypothetical protein